MFITINEHNPMDTQESKRRSEQMVYSVMVTTTEDSNAFHFIGIFSTEEVALQEAHKHMEYHHGDWEELDEGEWKYLDETIHILPARFNVETSKLQRKQRVYNVMVTTTEDSNGFDFMGTFATEERAIQEVQKYMDDHPGEWEGDDDIEWTYLDETIYILPTRLDHAFHGSVYEDMCMYVIKEPEMD